VNEHFKKLSKRMILIGIIMAGGSLYMDDLYFTAGIVCGFILAVVNFWLIRGVVGGLLAGQRAGIRGAYAFKLAGFLLVLFVLIGPLGVDPIGIGLGFSVLVIVLGTGGAAALANTMDEEGGDTAEVESNDG
jgi:hypothetical protein